MLVIINEDCPEKDITDYEWDGHMFDICIFEVQRSSQVITVVTKWLCELRSQSTPYEFEYDPKVLAKRVMAYAVEQNMIFWVVVPEMQRVPSLAILLTNTPKVSLADVERAFEKTVTVYMR